MLWSCLILSVANIGLIQSESNGISSVLFNNYTPIKTIDVAASTTDQEVQSEVLKNQKVELKLFYESLCPDCIEFDPEFVKVVVKLGQNVIFHTYPYGNAQTTKQSDGNETVECQHGVPECYGNKLHACSIDILDDAILSLEYNACMMGQKSNDTAADKCGKEMKIPTKKVKSIKTCAKGPKGNELLVKYGEESELVGFDYVPYVLINGASWNGDPKDFLKDVCSAFANPPQPCPKDDD